MLRAQWQQKPEKPIVQIPRTAVPLSVSEAEKLARGCGKTVTRLCGLRDLIRELPRLGKVKVVTYNRHAVHEKISLLHTVKLLGSQGWIQGGTTHLRLFLNHWHYGFAVEEEYNDGYRYSFQFFDRDGTAVHKIYLTLESQGDIYQNIVACYRSADQRPRQSVAPIPRLPRCADEEIDRTSLRQAWLTLQDIQDLPALFRSFGVSRLQGLRLGGPDLAAPIALPDLQVFMEVMRDAALPLKFYVSNKGGGQTHTGFVSNVGTVGSWYTVLDTCFALYLRKRGITHAWIVRKPMHDGIVTALELYNSEGQNIFQLLSPYPPGHAEHEIWQRLLVALEMAPPSAYDTLATV